MKIGIHALWMDSDPNGGIATYVKALVAHLGALDAENDYTVYLSRPRASAAMDYLPPRFRTRVLWPRSQWIAIPVSLPLELLARPVDLLHVLAVAPPISPAPIVQSLLDITWETHPELYPTLIRLRLSALVRMTARRARKILTISEHSRRTIVECYGIPEDRVVVTYLGVDPIFRRVEDPDRLGRLRTQHGIVGPFILYVGKLQARKNIVRLLQAFHALKRERRLAHQLVLVGPRTWRSAEIPETIEKLGLQRDVILTGEFRPDVLPVLYSAADLFVFPSLCEGFGFPPLEAMACGAPVVASNATSLPEVVGDAGILVDPYSVADLTHAMYDVLTNEPLRRELVARGARQIRKFSSEAMAARVLDVYDEVVNREIARPSTCP